MSYKKFNYTYHVVIQEEEELKFYQQRLARRYQETFGVVVWYKIVWEREVKKESKRVSFLRDRDTRN
jgi:hypothetical protein